MVIVPADHGLQILPIMLPESTAVIMIVFRYIPAVKGFIQNIHTEFIAGFQQFFRAGIVRTTHSIVARILQQLNLSPLCIPEGAGAKDTVIMVNTAAPELNRGVIDSQSFYRRPFQLQKSKVCCGISKRTIP